MSTATLETPRTPRPMGDPTGPPGQAHPGKGTGAWPDGAGATAAAEAIDLRTAPVQADAPGRTRTRPRRRASSRPGSAGVRPPRLRRRRWARASGCRIDTPAAHQPAPVRRWRLTNRGIGVILVSGAVLAAAAITVITATALTVTSSDYQQPQTSLIGH